MDKRGFLILVILFTAFLTLSAQVDNTTVIKKSGIIEIGVHYSSWSIDLLESTVIDLLVPDVEDFDENEGVYTFDSSGNNFGIELRIFPGGKNGSFSIGLSYEWNNFNGLIEGQFDYIEEGDRIEGNVTADIELLPHSFNINLRWDLWPSARIHPYIGFGLGIGAMKGNIKAVGTAKTTHPDLSIEIDVINEEFTLKEILEEAEDEGEGIPINFIPIVQFQVGMRAMIIDKLYVLAEVALYNGLSFRGGIAFRF